MKKTFRILSLSLAAAVCIPCATCSGVAKASSAISTAKATFKIYVQYSDTDTKTPYDYMVKQLKKDYPNVTLQKDVAAEDNGQKLLTYAATGNMPDIVYCGSPQTETLAKSNSILTLDKDPAAASEVAYYKKNMRKSALAKLIDNDGHVYGFPFAGLEPELLYYNKDVFKKCGVAYPIKTYAQFESAVKKFVAKGVIPVSIFAKQKWIAGAFWDMFLTRENSSGAELYANKKATGSYAPYNTVTKELIKLEGLGLFAKGATNTDYDQAAQLFYTGKAAMFMNGDWEIAPTFKALGSKADWMYFPASDVATYNKSKNNFFGFGGAAGFSVSSKTSNKALAIKVAAYISEKYSEARWVLQATPFNAFKETAKQTVKFSPMMQRASNELNNATIATIPDSFSNATLASDLGDVAQKLCTTGYTIAQYSKDINFAQSDAGIK